MTRQYIGARYVIKIYTNSGDPSSAEWEASVNYEPLTMVTYNYGSYLSKKNVPATVGDPASNPTYWVQTGFYNGQIAQLQQDVADLQANDTKLENYIKQQTTLGGRKFILIGDSYNSDTIPGGGWGEIIIGNFGLTEGVNVWNSHVNVGGHRFGDGSFLSDLQALTSSFTTEDDESITDVVVVGDINDYAANDADVIAGVRAFDTYVYNRFTNAHCWFILGGWGTSVANMRENILKKYRWITQAVNKGSVHEAFHNLLNPKALFDDMVHPNDHTGIVELSACIRNIIAGGEEYINDQVRTSTFASINNPSDAVPVTGQITKSGVHVVGQGIGGEFSPAVTIQRNVDTVIAVATSNELFSYECWFPAHVLYEINAGQNYLDAYVTVHVYRGSGADINKWYMAIRSRSVVSGSFNVADVTNARVYFDANLGYIN